MARPDHPDDADPKSKERLDELLDEALEDSFPASDPPQLTDPAPSEDEPDDRED